MTAQSPSPLHPAMQQLLTRLGPAELLIISGFLLSLQDRLDAILAAIVPVDEGAPLGAVKLPACDVVHQNAAAALASLASMSETIARQLQKSGNSIDFDAGDALDADMRARLLRAFPGVRFAGPRR